MANKFLDITGTTYLWGKIKDKFVQKEVGKGLSTNDFTTDEKNKLKGLNNYTLPTASTSVKGGVKVGAGLSVTEDGILSATGGGTADAVEWDNVIGKPTKVSEFANDSGFQNATQVNAIVDGKGFLKAVPTEYVTDTELNAKGFLTSVPSEYVTDSELTQKGYQTGAQVESAITGKGYQTSSQVQALINNAVSGITGIEFSVVSSLPSSGKKGVIYLVANGGKTKNIYDEYIWITDKFEKIGSTEIDLTPYMKKTDMVEISNSEIDAICQ